MTETAELWQVPVTYGAVGATQAADLLKYPPSGFRPMETRARIGHGAARWEFAWVQTLSWGIQKRSGLHVELVDSPAVVSQGTYLPVAFDAEGAPVHPAGSDRPLEIVYSLDGSALVRPGDVAVMTMPFWPGRIPARVVYVIDEPNRKGFAYGTLPGHPERGEESFFVERRPDESVWLIIRAFSRPASAIVWAGYPLVRLLQAIFTERYRRALTGPIDG
ncbi:MAG: DUF1990 domain-containing protein [Pseudolysinimonas sp.]